VTLSEKVRKFVGLEGDDHFANPHSTFDVPRDCTIRPLGIANGQKPTVNGDRWFSGALSAQDGAHRYARYQSRF
jgi:hypothetical protein